MSEEPRGLPSMSKAALVLSTCLTWAHPTSQWYDQDKTDRSDTEKRDRGSWVHWALDRHNKGLTVHRAEPEDTGYLYDEDAELLYQLGAKHLDEVIRPRCKTVESEVCVGVNWTEDKADVFPMVSDREYPNMPGWQFGTADLFCRLHDGSYLIADWKTGGTEGAEEQLLTLAYGFQNAKNTRATRLTMAGTRRVFTSCLQLGFDDTRVPKLPRIWVHERDVTDSLDAHGLAMRMQWEELLEGKKTKPSLGIHCTNLYCPHLAYCDGVTDVVKLLADADDSGIKPVGNERLLMRMTDRPTSNAEAGYTMARISAAKRQMKYWEECLKEYVSKGGKVISGAHEWGPGGNGWRWRKQ